MHIHMLTYAYTYIHMVLVKNIKIQFIIFEVNHILDK